MSSFPPKSEGARSDSEQPGKEKKPYTKPGFRFERVFETSALACSKTPVTGSACLHRLPTKS